MGIRSLVRWSSLHCSKCSSEPVKFPSVRLAKATSLSVVNSTKESFSSLSWDFEQENPEKHLLHPCKALTPIPFFTDDVHSISESAILEKWSTRSAISISWLLHNVLRLQISVNHLFLLIMNIVILFVRIVIFFCLVWAISLSSSALISPFDTLKLE